MGWWSLTAFVLLLAAGPFAATAQAEEKPLPEFFPFILQPRYPYMVSLLGEAGTHICGGVLIAPRIVLTSAYCVEEFFPSEVLLGNFELSDHSSPFVEKLAIEGVEVHPDWDGNMVHGSDLALLKLAKKPKARAVELISEKNDVRGSGQAWKVLTVLGWGKTEANGSFAQVLMEGAVKFVPRQKCNEEHLRDGEVLDSMICAGGLDTGVNVCDGDQGGPLVVRGDDFDGDRLVGVVSIVTECNLSVVPGVYTRVTSFADWIAKTSEEMAGSDGELVSTTL